MSPERLGVPAEELVLPSGDDVIPQVGRRLWEGVVELPVDVALPEGVLKAVEQRLGTRDAAAGTPRVAPVLCPSVEEEEEDEKEEEDRRGMRKKGWEAKGEYKEEIQKTVRGQ